MKSSSPFISALLLIGGVFISLPAQTQLMPVEKVEPGMQGTGVTVFAGNERTEFSAEILGVLQNSMGPLRHLILARLEGGPLEDSGVIQGMSGSPVYIDDQLIGAVSYSLGSFSKDTIAGITPIGEMLREDLTPPTGAVRSIPSLPLPLSTDSLTSLTPNGLRASVPFETNQRDLTALAVSIPSFLGGLQPIPTPLTLSGFTRQSFDYLDPMFRSTGMVRVAGGGFSTLNQPFSDAPLEPGDPIGVGLIQGDLSMAGTGTVTYIDGNRVYAFGHQFYNAGPSTFPMTRVQDYEHRRNPRHYRS